MRAVVIYESLTGNTRKAGVMIARELTAQGIDAVACPVTDINFQALSDADLVVIGSWTDGVFVVGQRPGRAHRLRAMPALGGKRAVVYCTYALDPGRTLDKMTTIVRDLGAEVIGGMAIRRNNLAGGAADFADRLVAAVSA